MPSAVWNESLITVNSSVTMILGYQLHNQGYQIHACMLLSVFGMRDETLYMCVCLCACVCRLLQLLKDQ